MQNLIDSKKEGFWKVINIDQTLYDSQSKIDEEISKIKSNKNEVYLIFDDGKCLEKNNSLNNIKCKSVLVLYCNQTEKIFQDSNDKDQYNQSDIQNKNYQYNSQIVESTIITNQEISNELEPSQESENCLFDSLLITQITICYKCQLSMKENIISLPCLHQFHYECFKEMIIHLIQSQQTTLKCLCGTKFILKTLTQLDQFDCQNYTNQILLQQLQQIKLNLKNQCQDLKLKYCKNPFCQFFYINKEDLNENSVCPICL